MKINRKDLTKGICSGFTIMEMMVVFSIILILAAISIPIYQGSKKELALQRAVNKLAQDIRKAEEMAMAAKEFEGAIPKGGYGIYFNIASTASYLLFADSDGSFDYDSGEEVEEIKIETGVQISSFSPISPLNALNITFTPPDPTTRINKSTLTAATIILQIDNSTTSVKVLPTGLIYIE
jgi:prepilin-type N-terminal cleavage/methylation domain-containing protein